MDPILIERYRAMTPGVYRPQSPPKDVTVARADIVDFVDAVNIKREKGAPVVLKVEHRGSLDAIECGILQRAWMEGDDAYIDIAVLSDAIYKGQIVRTQQQVADGIRTGMMTCSWEGWNNYKSPAYTGDRSFRIWPDSYAVLLGGDQPAIPSAIPAAAADNTDPAGEYLRGVASAPERGISSTERGQSVTIEQALAKIAELEAKIKEMETAADKGKDAEVVAAQERVKAAEAKTAASETELAKYRTQEAEALKVKCADLTKTVTEKLLPAKRPEFANQLAAMDSDASRVRFLALIDMNIPELTPEQAQLAAGDAEKDSDPVAHTTKRAETMAAERKISFREALAIVAAEEQE
jgi:hypothetical protein